MRTIILLFSLLVGVKGLVGQSQYLTTKAGNLLFYTLPFSYEDLEPFIDKQTVEIHYSKHQKAYFDNFMKSIANTELASMSLSEIFLSISKYPEGIRNNSGGFYNHILYWETLRPGNRSNISENLSKAIIRDFGSMDELKRQLLEAATKRFGSGWAWLSVNFEGKLFISSTPNQDNPLMDIVTTKGFPIIAIDVWEHAYYLKYQNKRGEYLNLVWDAINWESVSRIYMENKK